MSTDTAKHVGHGFAWSLGYARTPRVHVLASGAYDAPALCGVRLAVTTRTSGTVLSGRQVCPRCQSKVARRDDAIEVPR